MGGTVILDSIKESVAESATVMNGTAIITPFDVIENDFFLCFVVLEKEDKKTFILVDVFLFFF